MIGILEVGTAPDTLVARFGDYSAMISELLLSVRENLEFRVYRVLDGEFPRTPSECDAWVISGSRHSVTSTLPWMSRLKEFIRSAASQQSRMVGICFGHQIMAVALGGTVQRSEHGWLVGRQEYQLHEWNGSVSTVALCAFHEDQVVSPPSHARVLGFSEHCPFAVLEYGDFGLSIQAHPEFSNDYTSALVSFRLKGQISQAEFDRSLLSLRQSTDSRWTAELIADKLGFGSTENSA